MGLTPLAKNKREQLACLLEAKLGEPRTFPLSYAQERVWFLDQLHPGSSAYNLTSSTRLALALDPTLLERCFNEIVRRHEALRTVFTDAGGAPIQRVMPCLHVPVTLIDLTGQQPAEAERLTRERADAEALAPFDLAVGPLLRITLIRLGVSDSFLLLTLHHIVVDGWSFHVLLREFNALYHAFAHGEPSPLPPLPLQYSDWATWQRKWLSGERLDAQLAYWRDALAGAPPVIDLPIDRPRPPQRSGRGASHHAPLGEVLTRRLFALGQREGATPFMTLLAGFVAVLHRWSGERDVVVGTPIANRIRAELENLIGLFINTLALRIRCASGDSFRAIVRKVREATLGAFTCQDLPFEKLVEELHPARDLSYTPLFQVMFVLQSQAPHEHGGGEAPSAPPTVRTAKFDLAINAYEHGDGVDVLWEYATDLFDAATIARLAGHFETLLDAACAAPDRALDDLPLLTAAENDQLARWSAATMRAEAGTVVEAFAAQVGRSPGAPAVVLDEETLDYAALAKRAGRIAARLRALGIVADQPVALCLERSLDLIAGLLGILKAGGACLPLDPSASSDRLAALAQAARPVVIVTQRRLMDRVGRLAPAAVLVDEPGAGAGAGDLAPATSPGQLAYIINSSRAAGQSVGVMVEHAPLLRHLCEAIERYGLAPGDRVLQFAGFGYDAAIEQALAPLLAGATVVVRGEGSWSAADLAHAVVDDGLSVLILPTDYWSQVASEWARAPDRLAGCRLRLVVVLGDGLAVDRLAAWRRFALPGVRLAHAWGLTETVIGTALHEITAADGPRASIGRALAGRSVQVVDQAGRLTPIGVPGELCVGGDLARGYLGEPALTAARFVADPLGRPGGRRFRTGERARRRPDGAIELLGKLGRRVVVAGFHVELDAIEAALLRHPNVGEALAVAPEDAGAARVIAYVIPRSGAAPGAAELQRAVAAQAPSYMVPAAIVLVDRLPDHADRMALPAPAGTPGDEVAPSPMEARLAAIWSEVLGLARVGVHDNFFDLGGHSLTATRVVARIRDSFDIELPLRTLFESPTVAELAIHLGRGKATSGPPLRRLPREADPPLSFAQERLWFLDQFQPGSAGYNIPSCTRLNRAIDRDTLERALGEIVRRHESLRTSFPIVDGRPVQRIHCRQLTTLPLVDLRHLPTAIAVLEARRLSLIESQTPFALASGPLLRAQLIRLASADHILLLTAHHIVADGWSFDVLLRELQAIYDGFAAGEPSPLPELPLQYADWSQWQRQWLSGERLDEQLAYWCQSLRGAPPVIDLPTDHPRPAGEAVRGAASAFWMPATLRRRLDALGLAEGATTFMTLLAGFAALLQRWSGQSDLVIGSPIANRTRAELEDMIGFFVNTLALRVAIRPDDTFRTLLRSVREVTLGSYAHQDLPFERLVEELRPQRDLDRNPVFQVMFVVQNAPGDGVDDDDAHETPQPAATPGGTAKFDLSLFVTETASRWLAAVEYNADLFDVATIERFERRLTHLLEAVADAPDAPLATLPLIEPDEADRLRMWSRGPVAAPAPRLTDRILTQAALTPDLCAVIWGDRKLSYAALVERARRVAGGLTPHVSARGGDRRVGLCVERTPDAVAALLGILLAGAAYVPLDPGYPAERLRLMVDDAHPAVVIADATSAPTVAGATIVSLDDLLAAAPIEAAAPCNLAYVIYTSGSTGRQKGVAMPQEAAANLIDWQIRRSDLPPGARTTQFAPWSFDVSFQELFATLGAGGCLVIVDDDARRDPALLWRLITEARIARLFAPPVALRALAEAATGPPPSALREIIAAGEQLVIGDALAAFLACAPQVALFNQYGPTETHVVTEHRVGADDSRTPPIGRPLPGVVAQVLDAMLAPAPQGVAGELYLGGAALARSYLDLPALTADRFVPDPSGEPPGARLYRTGDRVRWRDDGALEFLGRVDDQVKVRGFRIEPIEVEAALEHHPAVAAAAVCARGSGVQHALCAYLTPAGGADTVIDAAELRRFLRHQLPEHLIPSSFTIMSSLPLTPSGKLDRRALPAPAPLRGGDRGKVAPATPVEAALAAIWSEVLGADDIGAHDNFFDLGGHSLLATQVVARGRARFGVELPLRRLFEQPTVAGLAVEVVREQLARAEYGAVRRLAEIERLPEGDACSLVARP